MGVMEIWPFISLFTNTVIPDIKVNKGTNIKDSLSLKMSRYYDVIMAYFRQIPKV